MLEHYKSWTGLKKQLEEALCDSLKGRVEYFPTRYHKVHNSYGRPLPVWMEKNRPAFHG